MAAPAGLLCLLAASIPARAEAADDCLAAGQPARVAAVLDDLELALDDGRVLRLAGIDPARATPSRPTLGEDARTRLAYWLVGRSVRVRALSAAPDRWDRIPSLVSASIPATDNDTSAPDATWSVAEALLGAGWARAKPDSEVHACFSAFLTIEAKARETGLGLWADPYYAIVDADDRQGLAERTGSMALVEGRFNLRNGPRRVFVTLGRGPWGLVARLPTRTAGASGKGGLDLQGLAGVRVRVRGFLDDRFGLRIDLASGDQIEALGPDSADLPATPAAIGQRPAQHDRAGSGP